MCREAGGNSITNKGFLFEQEKRTVRKFCQYFFAISFYLLWQKKQEVSLHLKPPLCGAPHSTNPRSFSARQEEGCDQQPTHSLPNCCQVLLPSEVKHILFHAIFWYTLPVCNPLATVPPWLGMTEITVRILHFSTSLCHLSVSGTDTVSHSTDD